MTSINAIVSGFLHLLLLRLCSTSKTRSFLFIVKQFPPLFIITFQPHLPLSHLLRFESLFYFLFVVQKVTQRSFDIFSSLLFVAIHSFLFLRLELWWKQLYSELISIIISRLKRGRKSLNWNKVDIFISGIKYIFNGFEWLNKMVFPFVWPFFPRHRHICQPLLNERMHVFKMSINVEWSQHLRKTIGKHVEMLFEQKCI